MDDPVKASQYIKGKTHVTMLFALIRLNKLSDVKNLEIPPTIISYPALTGVFYHTISISHMADS